MAGAGGGLIFARALAEHGNLVRSNSTSSTSSQGGAFSVSRAGTPAASTARRLNASSGRTCGTSSGNSLVTIDSKTKRKRSEVSVSANLEFEEWNAEVVSKSKYAPGSGKTWR